MKKLIWSCCMVIAVLYAPAQDNPLYLNPENALGAKAAVLFSDAELVPLETTKASYFSNIVDFLVTPNHYIFLDNVANAVFIFDKQGRFLHKYKKKKYELHSIQYIRSENAVFITGQNKNYTIPELKAQQMMAKSTKTDFTKYKSFDLLYLNPESRYKIKSLHVPRQALINAAYYFNGSYITINNRYNKYLNDTVAYHLNIVDNNKVTRPYFPFFNITRLPSFYEPVYFAIDNTTSDTNFFIQKQFDNTVYKLTADSLIAQYRFVFPADQTMQNDFQTTLFKDNIDYNTAKNKNNKAVSGLYNMLEHQHYFFFSTYALSSARKNFIFNTIDKKLYDLGKVTSDSTMLFLPTKIFSTMSERDADYVYTRISAADLIKEKEKMLQKNQALPQNIQQLLARIDKFDNAIIVKLKVQTLTSAK